MVARLHGIVGEEELALMVAAGYVRRQTHPSLPLAILNYTKRCQYDRAWNQTTRACRGLIYDTETLEVVARPFPKFHNHGEHDEGTLDLDAPAVVTDKLDGSLGILYPDGDRGYAVATRGSFTSDQALHATRLYVERYEQDALFEPLLGVTYLFEILAPWNRIVCDYGDRDDLVLLDALDTESGLPAADGGWPGPRVETFGYANLAAALAAPPRPNSEGLVVYLPDTNERVKIKQDDYVALHRILTNTNARDVWEAAAVRACAQFIRDRKHWGTYLGIDPARAEQLIELGDGWLDGVPDEFFGWVREVIETATRAAIGTYGDMVALAFDLSRVESRADRYERARHSPYVKEVMRLADAKRDSPVNGSSGALAAAAQGLILRCWRECCPEPTAPFARDEAIA